MKIKIGINGLGRIGRMIIRSIIERKSNNFEIKHINNRTGPEVSSNLLKYDSIHGRFNSIIKFDNKNITIGKQKISCSQETNIENLNWKKYDVDYVFECTGKFNSKEKLLPHLKNGAKKVIVSAPCKNADKTIVYGVNENTLKKDDKIISAASCTTNCLAPVANVLNNNYQIEKGFMTTIHAFTTDQRILDNSHKDPRRARSASQSIVPTSTGASKAIGDIIPSLKGKLEGVAMRVPTPNVSLIELVFCTKKDLTVEKINKSFLNESKKSLKGVLDITEYEIKMLGKDKGWETIPADVPKENIDPIGGETNGKLVKELIELLDEKIDSHRCSGENAKKTLDIMMSIYQSARINERVHFPVTEKEYPLELMANENKFNLRVKEKYDIRGFLDRSNVDEEDYLKLKKQGIPHHLLMQKVKRI